MSDCDAEEKLGPTVGLSVRALKYAEKLHSSDLQLVADRLYRFNCLPASPRWLRRLPSPDALRDLLDLERTSTTSPGNFSWWRARSTADQTGWALWQRGKHQRDHSGDLRFKLYVSPAPDELVDRFSLIVRTLCDTEAAAVKVGNTVYGLLRPDKLVAYFRDRESLLSAVRHLSSLADMSAHGVPFTASLSDNGLLSWGVDPPTDGADDSRQRESWRSRVTRRLAAALIQAQSDVNSSVAPWRFALDQLSLEGIDTTTFAPASTGWIGD